VNLGLQFNPAITLKIFVGSSLNGQTLNIQRSISGSSGWTSDGIVAPGTCVVADGFCVFQATKASYYATTHTVSSGGGGATIMSLSVFNEKNEEILPAQATLTWFTNLPGSTRIVYDTTSHESTFGTAPNYGYANSTVVDTSQTTFHTNLLTGLTPGAAYFWRAISSQGGPEVWGVEMGFITPAVLGQTTQETPAPTPTPSKTPLPSSSVSPSVSPKVTGTLAPEETPIETPSAEVAQTKGNETNQGLLATIGVSPFNWKLILLIILLVGIIWLIVWYLGKGKKKPNYPM